MHFDDGIYPEFVRRRIASILYMMPPNFFKGKKILEAGCGYGYAGELLEKKGAQVTSLDARKEHIEEVKKRYPMRGRLCLDLNKDKIKGPYDAILAIGLLYHLEDPEHFINEACGASNHIIISTIVCDSFECKLEERKCDLTFDQGTTPLSYIPTPLWIQKAFWDRDMECDDISNSKANIEGNMFDWEPVNCNRESRAGKYLRKIYYAHSK